MLEYEFETVPTGRGFFVGKTLGYRETIRNRAERGWRYAGFVPAKQGAYGAVTEIDLVFERETEEWP